MRQAYLHNNQKRPLLLKHDGFTLIEMFVVIAIISLMALLALPIFTSYGSNTRLKTAAGTLQNDTKSTQHQSINGYSNRDKNNTIRSTVLLEKGATSYRIMEEEIDKNSYQVILTKYKTVEFPKRISIYQLMDGDGATHNSVSISCRFPTPDSFSIPMSRIQINGGDIDSISIILTLDNHAKNQIITITVGKDYEHITIEQ